MNYIVITQTIAINNAYLQIWVESFINQRNLHNTHQICYQITRQDNCGHFLSSLTLNYYLLLGQDQGSINTDLFIPVSMVFKYKFEVILFIEVVCSSLNQVGSWFKLHYWNLFIFLMGAIYFVLRKHFLLKIRQPEPRYQSWHFFCRVFYEDMRFHKMRKVCLSRALAL